MNTIELLFRIEDIPMAIEQEILSLLKEIRDGGLHQINLMLESSQKYDKHIASEMERVQKFEDRLARNQTYWKVIMAVIAVAIWFIATSLMILAKR